MCPDRSIRGLRIPESEDIGASAMVVRAWRAEASRLQVSIIGGESIEYVRCVVDVGGHLSIQPELSVFGLISLPNGRLE